MIISIVFFEIKTKRNNNLILASVSFIYLVLTCNCSKIDFILQNKLQNCMLTYLSSYGIIQFHKICNGNDKPSPDILLDEK